MALVLPYPDACEVVLACLLDDVLQGVRVAEVGDLDEPSEVWELFILRASGIFQPFTTLADDICTERMLSGSL